MADSNSVQVFVRTRPTANFPKDIIVFGEDFKTVTVKLDPYCKDCVINNKKKFEWRFCFDGIFHQSSQESVYLMAVSPLISQAFGGYSACIMAYGQVGSGKSYTMVGPEDDFMMRGVVPRSLTQVFDEMDIREEDSSSVVKVSYVEIYNDKIIDLLADLPAGGNQSHSTLTLTESLNGVVSVNGLTLKTVKSEEDALNMFFEGEFHRTVSYHPLNVLSSRSHAIFTVYLETSSKILSNADVSLSKLHFVDLGGTERLHKSQPIGHTESEAKAINKSLSFLEQVLLSLTSPKLDHVPYRQCKLTQYLTDSLHAASNIVLLANIRGELECIEETISTFKFATRAKGVSTNPVSVKADDEQKLTNKYEKEIKLLRQELRMQDLLHCGGTTVYDVLNEVQITNVQKQVKEFVEGTIPELKVSTVRQTKEAFNQLKSYISTSEKSHEQEALELRGKVDSLEAKIQALQTDQPEVTKASSKGNVKKSVSYNKTEDSKEPGVDDGLGITLGKAPAHLKHPVKPSSKTFSISRVSVPEQQKKKRDSKTSTGDADIGMDSENGIRPSTPPPREEAFETFKANRGKELHAVFLQNKATLAKKKNNVVSIKQKLKEMNDEIVKLQNECAEYKDTSKSIMTTDGRLVLRECEYTVLLKLKQTKSEFKVLLVSLEATRAEVPVCVEHVNHSRKRLLKEFESWYKDAFIGESTGQEHLPIDKSALSNELVTLEGTEESNGVSSSIAYHRANHKAKKKARALKLSEKKRFQTTV